MSAGMLLDETVSGWKSDRSIDTTDNTEKQTARLAKGLAAHNMKPLPDNYVLGDHDVICGRGRKCFNHIGNQRFRKMVQDLLTKYSEASAKLEKTYIICAVVNRVRENSPDGGFVKKDPMTSKYFEVGDFLAREKTSQAFRDALHDQYKSSNAAKKKRRLQEQAQKLHKQHSAPLLNLASIKESTEEIYAEMQYQNVHSYNLNDYAQNNSKFMRVERQEPMYESVNLFREENPTSDLLLGEVGADTSNKRQLFASQKSATSIIDEARQTAPAWFNRSCPNLNNNTMSEQPGPLTSMMMEEKEQPERYLSFDDFHHSQPNLYDPMPSTSSSGHAKKSLLRNRMMANKKSRSDRHLMNTTISNHFDIFDSPEKSLGTTAPLPQEDIVLSPIGDGSTRGLFEKLQGIEEVSNRSEFDPLPLPF